MIALLLAAALALPPGTPDVSDAAWRMVGSRLIPIRQQGTDAPYVLLAERYLDATNQNEVELRRDIGVEGSPVVVVAWGKAAAEAWERFFINSGYVACVNKQHVIPATPAVTEQWYDLFGPEADACRTLSSA